MSDLSPGPAVYCEADLGGCETLSPLPMEQARTETCPLCGEHAPMVTIIECANGDPETCDQEEHHFGFGVCFVEGMVIE